MKLTNHSPDFATHPLRNLLIDSMRAATGGSSSSHLVKAWAVKGWEHSFEGWQGAYSIESITWENETVFNQLVEIYR